MNWLAIWLVVNQAFLDGHVPKKDDGLAPDALVTVLTISPTKRPSPNNRYRLPILPAESAYGNAPTGYLAAIKAMPERLADREQEWQRQRRMDDWVTSKPRDLQLDWVRKELVPYQGALSQIQDSSRMRDCHWPDPRPRRITSVNNTEIQKLREMLTPLELRFKVELAEKRYDDAFRTIRTLYQFGFHLGRGSDSLRVLVGFATVAKGHQAVVAWLEDPDSPGLYDALASRPRPFFHPQTMLEGEREVFLDFCRYFRACNRGLMRDEEVLAKHVECESKLLSSMALGIGLVNAVMGERAREPDLSDLAMELLGPFREAAEAKRDLIKRGWPIREVEAMHPIQAAYASAWLRADETWNEAMGIWKMPMDQRLRRWSDWERSFLNRQSERPWDRLFQSTSLMIIAQGRMMSSHLRVERQFDLLQTVEAIRIHAGETGKWPEKLNEIRSVQLPNDPVTGQPFDFKRVNDKIVLETRTAFPGQKKDRGNTLRYVLKLKPINLK